MRQVQTELRFPTEGIMKKLSLLIAVCILLCGSFPVHAAERAATDQIGYNFAVLAPVAQVTGRVFKEGENVYKAANNICINVVQGDDAKTNYLQPAFFQYNLDEYKDYDIEEAALIWQSGNNKNFFIYDVPGNDLTLTETDTVPERIAVGDVITSHTYAANSPALDTDVYQGGIPDGANLAFDITSYLKSTLAAGNNSFSVMFYAGWGGSIVFKPWGAKLWIRYSANTKPSVKITSPESATAVTGRDLVISADISDSDGSIYDAEFWFDGRRYTPLQSGDSYRVTVSGELITDGEHTIKIIATDNEGAVTTVEKKIYASSYFAANAKLTYSGGGDVVFSQLKAGAMICASADVTSLVDYEMPITIFAVIYDNNGVMKKIAFNTTKVSGGDSGVNVEVSLKIPNTLDLKTAVIKTYITNGRRSMRLTELTKDGGK